MDIGVIVGHVVNALLIIFGPVLSILAVAIFRALLRKLKISAELFTVQQIDWAVECGVRYAEEWARKQVAKPSGSQKADMAFEVTARLLDDPILKQYGIEPLQQLIRAKVGEIRKVPPTTATITGTASSVSMN